MALPGNAMIRLGWVKAHIVIKGNEKADILAKDATRDGTSADHPFPKSYLKKQQSSVGKLSRIMTMWGNRKSPTLSNEIPTNFIISPQGTKPTIHHPLVEERPIQQTLKPKIDHLIKFLETSEDLIKSQNYNTDTDSSLEIGISTDSPPGTRNSMNTKSSSRAS
ncbi:hypothetical protein AVEN_150335-1 [Araneus ventricosus]|uniref:RNase H type-1 domain-containing protein n=1 Tax=Araneus ventricosus TaxID=182803 RepID=A0A4Y2V6L8_ARAVE|nr:hypothetical protein AVEN_150335-1 [Araneus ventricosus]